MSQSGWLEHPEHGPCAAEALLDCVFALTPSGRILHHHREEFAIEPHPDGVLYVFNGEPPAPERARCQVIPPLVNAFHLRGKTPTVAADG